MVPANVKLCAFADDIVLSTKTDPRTNMEIWNEAAMNNGLNLNLERIQCIKLTK